LSEVARHRSERPPERLEDPGDGEDAGDGGLTFEELMAELEAVTERLAAGDLGIEAAADLYERAEQLHARAADRLGQVRARVERLAEPGGSSTA